MKKIHLPSFGLGIVSGLLILLLVSGGMKLMNKTGDGNGANGFGLARMAERLNISESDLQKELQSGKTFQQIAQEHGVQYGFGRGGGFGSGSSLRGSGSKLPLTGSGSGMQTASGSSAAFLSQQPRSSAGNEPDLQKAAP